ncbi:hypothetical protein VKT23_020415 [Stygiomarasmius scandens]|uniref:Uncharacterized protein n=1 Tax=Marasmiellus scandens TaxID=2682957 RepID=A0ABR1IJ44_9AGAR
MSATATSSPFDYGSNPAPLARKTLLCVDSRRVLREGISKLRRAKKMRWLSLEQFIRVLGPPRMIS